MKLWKDGPEDSRGARWRASGTLPRRGYSLGEMLLPCGILLGVGAAGFAFGSMMFRRLEAA
jgi:hypothetical protein